MAEVCYITTCMGRLHHLQETLPTWLAQSHASWVVVDYSCPNGTGNWIEKNYPQVKVVRVTDQANFHLPRARNIGAQVADAEWLCFIDADVALDPSFCEKVSVLLQPGHFYPFASRIRNLCGTVLVSRADFVRAEGYDEAIRGWGDDDTDFYARLRWLGVTQNEMPANFLHPLRHDDQLRMQFYSAKDKELSWTINRLYLEIKFDMMKLIGPHPGIAVRHQLYALVTNWVKTTVASGAKKCDLKVPIRRIYPLTARGSVETCLFYTLSLEELRNQFD